MKPLLLVLINTCARERVAPVALELEMRQWREFFIGGNPANREAVMLSKEGGGPLNNS